MRSYLNATLLLCLVSSGNVLAVSSWDAEELGRTHAQAEACIQPMRAYHDWKLNRDLKDLVESTEEEIQDSPEYSEKIDRGAKDGLSEFRSLSKDGQEELCRNLAEM